MGAVVNSAVAGPVTARYSNIYGALTSCGVLPGYGAQDKLGSSDPVAPILNSSTFFAPLKSTLVLTRGSGNPTYSRATAAWEMDNEGKLITVPSGGSRFGGGRMVRNHATYTQDLSNAIWSKTRSNISANATTAPDGTLTADKLYDDSTAANSHICGQMIGNPVATGTYRATIRAKAAEYTYCQFRVTIDPASGNHQYGAVFNLSNGTIYDSGVIRGTPTETACSIESIGDGWYLLSLKVGNPNNKRLDIQVNLLNGFTTNIENPGYNGDGTSGIYLWGLQVENVAGQADQTASEYVSVGVLSAPYHGAGVDGVKWFETNKAGTALSEASLLGYHAEGARTNSLLYSRDLTNAAWAATNITPAKTATGIDNAANSASTLTASAADATILQTLSLAAAARSSSAYIKKRTLTYNQTELVTNGGFDTDISGWSKSYGDGIATWSNGKINITGGTLNTFYSQTIATIPGSTLVIQHKAFAISATRYSIRVGGVFVETNQTSFIPRCPVIKVSGASTLIDLIVYAGETVEFDDISIKESACAFTRDGGTYWSDFTYLINDSNYTRIKLENTSITNPSIGFKISTSGDAIDVDVVQDEAGAKITSPIITTTTAVTRNADAETFPTASNWSDTAGWMLATVYRPDWDVVAGGVIGSATNGLLPLTTNTGAKAYDGSNTVNGPAGAPSGTVKMAATWGSGALQVAANGTAGTAGSYDGAWGLASIGIGASADSCYIKNVYIAQSALNATQLAQVTA